MDIDNAAARVATVSSWADIDLLAECIEACTECAQSCTACADACLSERNIQELVRCIRLNQDSADVAETTGRFLSRATDLPARVMRSALQTCAAICAACEAECETFRDRHSQCRLCADACSNCIDACERVMALMSED